MSATSCSGYDPLARLKQRRPNLLRGFYVSVEMAVLQECKLMWASATAWINRARHLFTCARRYRRRVVARIYHCRTSLSRTFVDNTASRPGRLWRREHRSISAGQPAWPASWRLFFAMSRELIAASYQGLGDLPIFRRAGADGESPVASSRSRQGGWGGQAGEGGWAVEAISC